MPGGYPWRASFNPVGAAGLGNFCAEETPATYYFFSPLALTTYGFLFGPGDIWFNLDASIIQNVVWSPA